MLPTYTANTIDDVSVRYRVMPTMKRQIKWNQKAKKLKKMKTNEEKETQIVFASITGRPVEWYNNRTHSAWIHIFNLCMNEYQQALAR